LGTTNAALAKKAEAAAVTALTQQVEQNGRDIRSNTDSITSLSNQLVNGQPNAGPADLSGQLANATSRHSAIFAPWHQRSWMKCRRGQTGLYRPQAAISSLYSWPGPWPRIPPSRWRQSYRDDTGAILVNGVQVATASAGSVSFAESRLEHR
jgi:hypothetical protein